MRNATGRKKKSDAQQASSTRRSQDRAATARASQRRAATTAKTRSQNPRRSAANRKQLKLPNFGAITQFAQGHRIITGAIVVVVILLVALYGPLQGLYCAWRTNTYRQAELTQVQGVTDGYRHDIERLQTEEGIKDEARRRGYVEQGETALVVESLPAEEPRQQADPPAPAPWYIGVLDVFFGFKPEQL